MIVNYTANGWEIITQRAHGLLSAQVASHWRKADRTKRWVETLIAIAEHDDAQVELENDDLLTEQGGPVNFKMKHFNLEHGRRTMDFSISKSRYIALLCSMHIEFVYEKDKDSSPEAKQFFDEQVRLRAKWRKELGISVKQAEHDYRLLEWCDALSLLLCQRENQPESRAIEISKGPADRPYELIQHKPHTLTVVPWPFEEDNFEVEFEWRLIPQLQFKSCDDFKVQFNKVPINYTVWKLEK